MNCSQARQQLPGYLDGAIRATEHFRLREHLASCEACRRQLDGYRRMASHLAKVEPVPAPADLALRIRLRASREESFWAGTIRWWSGAMIGSRNLLQPLAVPATGGVLTALAVFALLVHGMLTGVPMGGTVPNDLPLNLVQPAQLESLAPFPLPSLVGADGQSSSSPLLVEAMLNAEGEVVYYRILSGPNSRAVQHQIDELLLFSRFRPQLNFGRPMDGGRVLLSFSGVNVRG